MNKISKSSRICLAIALGTSLLCSIAASADSDSDDEGQKILAGVRLLHYKGGGPSLDGFSPARPIDGFTAPLGDHSHTQAFIDDNTCVAFFLAASADTSGVAFKWDGAKCNGKPLEGKGELQILRKVATEAGTDTVVGIFRGEFSKGMLTGEGMKANFTFDHSGKLQDIYTFQGNFENSVLNGTGVKRWSGASTDEPSAFIISGDFKDGTPQGAVTMGRLNPLPGVEADYTPLFLNSDGDSYINQSSFSDDKAIDGWIFFYNDPASWKMETYNWRGYIETGTLTRQGNDGYVKGICIKWSFSKEGVSCTEGSIFGEWRAQNFILNQKPFVIPVPYKAVASSGPFRVKDGESVFIDGAMAKPISCNSDLSRCSGKIILDIRSTPLYWYGEATVRDGSIYMASGGIYEHADGQSFSSVYEYDTDQLFASCSRMKSPLVCAEGTIYFEGGDKVSGGWKFDGIDFDLLSYEAKRPFHLLPIGDVKFTYSDGSWAEATMDDAGNTVSVGDCDRPSSSAKFTCRMDGDTMMFRGVHGQPSEDGETEEPSYIEKTAPPRFQPIVEPPRQGYVLPGMQ